MSATSVIVRYDEGLARKAHGLAPRPIDTVESYINLNVSEGACPWCKSRESFDASYRQWPGQQLDVEARVCCECTAMFAVSKALSGCTPDCGFACYVCSAGCVTDASGEFPPKWTADVSGRLLCPLHSDPLRVRLAELSRQIADLDAKQLKFEERVRAAMRGGWIP